MFGLRDCYSERMDLVFGTILRHLRKSKKKSIVELAKTLRISSSYVSDVECGKRPPFSPKRIHKIISLLQPEAALEKQLWLAAVITKAQFDLPYVPVKDRLLLYQQGHAHLMAGLSSLSAEQVSEVLTLLTLGPLSDEVRRLEPGALEVAVVLSS